ncbi:hypothetical protein Q9R27_08965 [Nocardioides sp. AE5]|nr:hypothetical protein [Nocardioides sp. AE5]MDT0202080.1 hypothetical protein [Nocardioides sp. AE5]
MNWLNRAMTTLARARRASSVSTPSLAIRPAAEKLSGAITAAPRPSRVNPATATGHVGAATTTARAVAETTAAARSTGTGPKRVTSQSPDRRITRVASR